GGSEAAAPVVAGPVAPVSPPDGPGDGSRIVGVNAVIGPIAMNRPRPAVAAETTSATTASPVTSATSGRRKSAPKPVGRAWRRPGTAAAPVGDASQAAIAVVRGTAATMPRLPTRVRTISTLTTSPFKVNA